MSNHTATTLAYVRTSAGVVRVDVDGDVPADVDDTELRRLVAGGAIAEAVAAPPATPPVPVPTPPSGSRGRGRGKGSRES